MSIFYFLGKLYPNKTIEKLEFDLNCSKYVTESERKNYSTSARSRLGTLPFIALFLTAFFVFLLYKIYGVFNIPISIISFIVFFIIVEYVVLSAISARARDLADQIVFHLPDILTNMAISIESGRTFIPALNSSLKEDYGPVKKFFGEAYAKIKTGTPIKDALLDITKYVQSKTFKQVMINIGIGVHTKSDISGELRETADLMRTQYEMREDIKSLASGESNQIRYITTIMAPIIYAIGFQFKNVISVATEGIPVDVMEEYMNISLNTSVILQDNIVIGTLLFSLILTLFEASLIISLIQKNNTKAAFRYFLPMILFAAPIFFFALYMLRNLFGGIF